MGVIQSQRRELGLSDQEYRERLKHWTGLDSTKKMDLRALGFVRDQFNLLIERTHWTTDT
jgi:hypothetical protein